MMQMMQQDGGSKFDDVLGTGSKLVDDRVAPFHTEFSRAGRLPPGCNAQAVQRFVCKAYEEARSQNLYEVMVIKGDVREAMEVFPREIAMRLGSSCSEEQQEDERWLFTAPLGSIRSKVRHHPLWLCCGYAV
jgi:hypothetical protein